MYKFSTNKINIEERDAQILDELSKKYTKGQLIDYLLNKNPDSGYDIIGKLVPATY